MATVFKPGDEKLQQLVSARRDEVLRLQKSEALQLQDIEKRGNARAKEMHDGLPAELVAFMDKQSKAQDDASTEARREVEEIKKQLIATPVAAEAETALHPGLAGTQLVGASALGWFSPYYGVLHWSDGTVVWEGYNPGNIDLWDWAEGAGTGNGGTGAASRTLIMDWWFTYRPTTSGYYNHSISVPYHGFYIVRAFDDWLTSRKRRRGSICRPSATNMAIRPPAASTFSTCVARISTPTLASMARAPWSIRTCWPPTRRT